MASKTVTAAVKVSIEGKEYKATMREINRENKEFKKQQKEAMKQAKLSAEEGFGGVIALAKKMAPAVSAGAAAFEVVKRAVQSNNSLFDEYERTMAAAQASFTSFSTSLARVDFSNFIDQMGEVISNAREAASAIQDLDDAKLFGRKAQAEIDFEAEDYYSVLKNKNASRADVDAALAGLADLRTRQENVKLDEASANLYTMAARLAEILSSQGQSASALDFVRVGADGRYEKIAGTLFDKYFGNLTSFRQMTALYERFKDDNQSIINWQKVGYVTDKESGVTIGRSEYKMMRAALEGVTGEKMEELFGYYIDALSGLTAVRRSRNQDMRIAGRWADGGAAGSVGGGISSTKSYAAGSIAEINQRLSAAREEMNLATDDAAREVARKLVMALEEELSRAQTFRRASGVESIGNLPGLQGVGLKPLTLDPSVIRGKDGEADANKDLAESGETAAEADANKDLAESGETAAEGIMLVSDTLQRLGIMSNVADEGLRTTMRVVGQFLGMIGGFIGGPWGKGISALGSLVGSFSGGGIVGGTSYTGDRLTARVNSGEMILNATQQRSLFQMLNGGGSTGGGSSVVRGEDIYVALRNYGRRTGKIHLP